MRVSQSIEAALIKIKSAQCRIFSLSDPNTVRTQWKNRDGCQKHVQKHACHGKRDRVRVNAPARALTAAEFRRGLLTLTLRRAQAAIEHAWLPQLRCKLPQNGEARHVDGSRTYRAACGQVAFMRLTWCTIVSMLAEEAGRKTITE
jgi:hypothetical protein